MAHDAAIYEEDEKSKRLSVLVPFERPQGGTHYCGHLYEFMCLNSDVGGINRKPVKLIFTLEQDNGEGGLSVIGRVVFGLRTCSCPKRDKKQDEIKYAKDQAKAQGLADSLARSNSIFTKPTGKKRKANEVETFIMVPVSKRVILILGSFHLKSIFTNGVLTHEISIRNSRQMHQVEVKFKCQRRSRCAQ